MKHRFFVPAFFVVVLLGNGCVVKQAEFSVVSTKKIDLNMQEFEKVGENITGESVSNMIFIFSGPQASIDESIQNALKKVNGDIMTDTAVYQKFWMIPGLYAKLIIEVKGTAWKLKDKNQIPRANTAQE